MNNQKAMHYFDVYKKHCRAKFALAEIKTLGGRLAYAMVDMEMLREYVHMDSTASKKQAETGGDEIRENWVRRRMYSLIGEYARNPSPAILDAMQRLSLETGMPIPYRQQFIR